MSDMRALGRIQSESRLAPEHRIYVNRNLRMENIRAIGFDLDHTLAHYRGPAVEELAYRLARRILVETYGYPEALLEVPYDRSRVIRGLVIDKRRGNVLKMDYHNYVSRVAHGFHLLPNEERKRVYGTGRVRMKTGNYVSVDTLFHLPEVVLFQVLVDLVERGPGRKPRTFSRLFEDVRASVDAVHADGSLKEEITGNLDKYIRRDSRLLPTLRELSRTGKKLFLLTNSEPYYTRALLRFLLRNGGSSWRDFFDVVVVEAGKPGFFIHTDRKPEILETEEGRLLRGGNVSCLEKELGFRGDEILYFGDHTYGDILRSKKSSGWRTAMVVEELREEIQVTRRVEPQLEELEHWKALRGVLESDLLVMEVEQRKLARKLEDPNGSEEAADRTRRRLDTLSHELERLGREMETVRRTTGDLGDAVNESYNSMWGPIFREGREVSRFGHQVKDFACIYMTKVSNLLHYDMNQYFRSASERMPHEL